MNLASLGQLMTGQTFMNAIAPKLPMASIFGRPDSQSALLSQLAGGLVAGGTQVPDLQDLNLEQYATPEELAYLGDLQLAEMSPTELRKILLDPRLEQAQFDTLSKLDEISNTGMSAIDRARLADIQAQQATNQSLSDW